jgi:glycosyltransferase involved in cell wall biosynthesis
MAVHNGERYVKSAIDSILSQTLDDFEFIVIDDCSNDTTPNILKSCGDARIKVLRNEIRCGLASSLNAGLEVARGKYVARQDADDISLPHRLEEQLRYLMVNPETALLGTWAELIDEKGHLTGEHCPVLQSPKLKWVMLFHNKMTHSSVVFDTEKTKGLGGYDPCVAFAQDYDLWCRIMKTHEIAILPQKLVRLRYHPYSISSIHKEAQDHSSEMIVLRNVKWYCTDAVTLRDIRILRSILQYTPIAEPDSLLSSVHILEEVFGGFMNSCQPHSPGHKALKHEYARTLGVIASMHANVRRRGTWPILLKAFRSSNRVILNRTILLCILKVFLGPKLAIRMQGYRSSSRQQEPLLAANRRKDELP